MIIEHWRSSDLAARAEMAAPRIVLAAVARSDAMAVRLRSPGETS